MSCFVFGNAHALNHARPVSATRQHDRDVPSAGPGDASDSRRRRVAAHRPASGRASAEPGLTELLRRRCQLVEGGCSGAGSASCGSRRRRSLLRAETSIVASSGPRVASSCSRTEALPVPLSVDSEGSSISLTDSSSARVPPSRIPPRRVPRHLVPTRGGRKLLVWFVWSRVYRAGSRVGTDGAPG